MGEVRILTSLLGVMRLCMTPFTSPSTNALILNSGSKAGKIGPFLLESSCRIGSARYTATPVLNQRLGPWKATTPESV